MKKKQHEKFKLIIIVDFQYVRELILNLLKKVENKHITLELLN